MSRSTASTTWPARPRRSTTSTTRCRRPRPACTARSRCWASPDPVTGPINIGNPQEHSMLQLAQMVIDLTGSRSRVAHRPLPQDDPRQRRPDISKANELLSWNPKTPVRDGLIKTIAYFDELLRDQGTRARLLANA